MHQRLQYHSLLLKIKLKRAVHSLQDHLALQRFLSIPVTGKALSDLLVTDIILALRMTVQP
jgi:hypothetical protein